MVDALSGWKGDLAGRYRRLSEVTEAGQQQLIGDPLLVDKPVSPLLTAVEWLKTGQMLKESVTTMRRVSWSG